MMKMIKYNTTLIFHCWKIKETIMARKGLKPFFVALEI